MVIRGERRNMWQRHFSVLRPACPPAQCDISDHDAVLRIRPVRTAGCRDPGRADAAARYSVSGSGVSLNTAGDDPGELAAVLRNRAKVPSRPVPRLAGKPDFSGVWLANEDRYPEQPTLLPWAVTALHDRIGNARSRTLRTRDRHARGVSPHLRRARSVSCAKARFQTRFAAPVSP